MFDFTERTRYYAIVDSEWSAQLDGCFVPLICCSEKWVLLVRRCPQTLNPTCSETESVGRRAVDDHPTCCYSRLASRTPLQQLVTLMISSKS